jgi:hypothetical protein
MMGAFQQGMLTLQRLRTGGQQRVIVEQHQYITKVEDGGQAVIAPKVKGRGGSKRLKTINGNQAGPGGGARKRKGGKSGNV